MFEHRFRDQLAQLNPSFAAVPAMAGACMGAFVPCPMFMAFGAAHQTQIQEVYRLAAERTREQLLQNRRRSRLPQFSRN